MGDDPHPTPADMDIEGVSPDLMQQIESGTYAIASLSEDRRQAMDVAARIAIADELRRIRLILSPEDGDPGASLLEVLEEAGLLEDESPPPNFG